MGIHKFVFFIFPSFSSRGLLYRIVFSVILVAVIAFIFFSIFDLTFEHIKAAVQYDPYQHAKTLYDEGKIADADEFLTFYSEIPYVEISEPMRALHDEVREKRSSVMYHLSEMKRGLIEGESDEWLGQGVAFGTEFFFIGDVRDLSKQGIKYYKGEQVDKLTVGLASLGLAMSAVSSWGPQAAVGAPAKNSLGLFRRLSKTLKASMRKNIDDVAQVAYKLVKAQADKIAVKSSSFFDSVRKLDFSFIKKHGTALRRLMKKLF